MCSERTWTHSSPSLRNLAFCETKLTMRSEVAFIHGMCEFCRRVLSTDSGAPEEIVEVKLMEHISRRELLLVRVFARDFCTCISRFLAKSRRDATASVTIRAENCGLYLCYCDSRKKPPGTIATADRKSVFSNAKWLLRRKLYLPHLGGIPDLLRTFLQLLHVHVITDAAENELLCLCDDRRTTIPLSVKDKTAYEAVNNHEHLLDDLSDDEFAVLAADAPVLCRLVYSNIKMQYPQRKLAVYVTVSRHDSIAVRFHQVWEQEPIYYQSEDFSSGDERVFSLID